MRSGDELLADLRALGVRAGDCLFVHASYKTLGPLADGVETILSAFREAVGREGLLLMPSFHLIDGGTEARVQQWDVASTPSTTGYVGEAFRLQPDVVRSDHYCHSVAAWGAGADAFVREHRHATGMRSPWDHPAYGCDFGDTSPFLKSYHHPHGKILMLGVDYQSSTFCHLVEVMYWNECLQADAEAAYVWLNREALGDYWDEVGELQWGTVGQAESRLVSIRPFVDTLLSAVREEPGRWAR